MEKKIENRQKHCTVGIFKTFNEMQFAESQSQSDMD